MKLLKLALLLPIIFSAGCTPANDIETQKSASLRLGWIATGSFAGEIVGATKFSEPNGLDLTVRQGGIGMNTIALVATGEDTFGTLAADEVLLANEKGAELVIIGVINDTSPGAFVSLSDSGIESPTDFVGKTVGVLPFGSTTLLYEAMLEANNIDRTEIEERVISADLRPFLQGEYDVHPVFVYDETVTLDENQIAYNLIEPAKFGVDIKGPVYFTTQKVVDEKPELVEAFVKTMADGWSYALENREEAIASLKAFAPEIDEERELAVLNRGAPYFAGHNGQPINSELESWEVMATKLVELGKLEKEPNLNKTLRFEWIQEHYSDNSE